VGSHAVAVRAHDIALGGLGQDRWQFAHTTSHFATSSSTRRVDINMARPVMTLKDFIDGSR
jgi:hypothetical protein